MQAVDAIPSPAPIVARRYASFWQRFAAWLIDVVLVLAVTSGLSEAGSRLAPGAWPASAGDVGSLLGVVLIVGYFIWFTSQGATLGKLTLGIMVVGPADTPPGPWRAATRFVIQAIYPIGFTVVTTIVNMIGKDDHPSVVVLILATVFILGGLAGTVFIIADAVYMLPHPERQTLHDKVAGTWVIRNRTRS